MLNIIDTAAEFLMCGSNIQTSPVNATDTTLYSKLRN